MQIIILGMHRSGTSMMARLLNMMGAYYGPEGIHFGASEENAKGFWERKDVLQLHEDILATAGTSWDRIHHFDLEKIPDIAIFEKRVKNILLDLEAHRPWMLKDPRLCFTFPLWRKFLEFPVCIHIYRSPIQVAQSLKTRGQMPINMGIALWEIYCLSSIAASYDVPRILISHQELVKKPVKTVTELYNSLCELEVGGIRLPSEKEINAFVEKKLFRERGSLKLQDSYVNVHQARLHKIFQTGAILKYQPKDLPALSESAKETLQQYEETYKKFNSKDKELQEFYEKVSHFQNELTEQQTQSKEEIERLEKILQERTVTAESLQKTVQEYQEHTSLLEKSIIEQKVESELKASDFEKEKGELELEIVSLEEENIKQKEENDLQLSELRTKIACYSDDVNRLSQWLDIFVEDTKAVFTSISWRIGNGFMNIISKLLFIKKKATAEDHIKEITEDFHDWKAGIAKKK